MRSSSNFGIESIDQRLLLDVLKTVPVEIDYAQIDFLAEGIPRPDSPREGFDERGYVDLCSSKGVIPFSQVGLKYNSEAKVIVPETKFNQSLLQVYNSSSEFRRNSAIEGFLKGGKIHLLEFETSYDSFSYKNFQEKNIQRIVEEGYHIDHANLWWEVWHSSGYDEGMSRSSGLTIRSKSSNYWTKGVELEFPTNKDNKDKIIEWFTGLAERHNVEVLQPQETK